MTGPAALEQARRTGFRMPPPRRVQTPLVDIHTHVGRQEAGALLDAADIYGIHKILAIGGLDEGLRVRERFPDRVLLATTLLWEHRSDPAQFADDNEALLARAVTEDVGVVKLWFAPRIYERFDGLRLDAPLLDPIFAAIAELGLKVLVHVADPDHWFSTRYLDVLRYGAKAGQYPQLERRLYQYPGVRFLAAHMAGHPEDLAHLSAMLSRHPNLWLDTSATKWIVRELGRRREAARAFFERYADRLVFGTDQVVLDTAGPEHYLVRYWIHQMFWETDLVCESPLDDPDAETTPMLRGLGLPADVLRKMYWTNAVRWLAGDAAHDLISSGR